MQGRQWARGLIVDEELQEKTGAALKAFYSCCLDIRMEVDRTDRFMEPSAGSGASRIASPLNGLLLIPSAHSCHDLVLPSMGPNLARQGLAASLGTEMFGDIVVDLL